MRTRIHTTRAVVIATVLSAAPVTYAGQDAKATEVLATTRTEIGGKKLDSLKSLSVQAATQRNVGDFQLTSDLELLIDLPDKYLRSETSNSAMVNMASTMGFNGDRPVKGPAQAGMPAGGGMVIRMGGPGMPMPGGGQKLTPAEQEQVDRQLVRSAQVDISRLMLGWFAMTHPAVAVSYTYAGEAEAPDGKAFIVDANNADGFAARLFIDEKTHLPLMVTYKGPQPRIVTAAGPPPGSGGAVAQTQVRTAGQDEQKRVADEAKERIEQIHQEAPVLVEYTLFFDDWREDGGIKFPHAIRRSLAGTTTEEWSVSKVKVNPKIDPKKFESEH